MDRSALVDESAVNWTNGRRGPPKYPKGEPTYCHDRHRHGDGDVQRSLTGDTKFTTRYPAKHETNDGEWEQHQHRADYDDEALRRLGEKQE